MTDVLPDFLIDTSVLIQHIRQPTKQTGLTRSLAEYGTGAVSVITVVEYEAGEIHAGRVPNFTRDFPKLVLLTLSEQILRRASYLQASNIATNRKMDMADLLIAASAIYHKLPLLTLNTEHFRHVSTLRLLKVQ